jgi:hypothetical protein
MDHSGKIVLNGAPSQLDRWLSALDPAHAQVDGRSFPELLDFAVQFARLIRYYNLQNEEDGDWVEFFISDPTMILAAITAVDVAGVEAKYLRKENETRQAVSFERKFRLLRETFTVILDLARQIDLWLEALDLAPQDDASRALRQQIVEDIRDTLGAQLRQLKAYDEGAGLASALGEPMGLDYSGFLPVWDLGAVCPDGSIYRGATKNRKIDHALPFLQPVFYPFLDAVEGLRAMALANVPATLGGGDHKPQIALYIAFAQLFARAQETINSISRRYVDFYYRKVLREGLAPAIPDSVYLTFALAEEEGVLSAPVPQGTLFPAGEDADGRTILYAADRGLTVTAARIAALRTLRAISEPDGLPRQILSSEISLESGNSWATFGEDAPGTSDAEVTQLATLGFALAAEELLLTGGERTVTITFDCPFAGDAEILRTILKKRLRLVASTADAWFPVEGPEAFVDPSGFTLSFTLPPSAPPLQAFETVTTLPTVQAWLDQEPIDGIDPLPVLWGLVVQGCQIHVDVRGLSGMTVENTDGEIDPSTPFPLFGGLPVVGSFVQMRSVELFSKVPETLSVTIDWFNLPPNDTGFQGYYRDYTIGLDGKKQEGLFDNQTFRGAFTVRDPGAWTIADDSPPEDVFLFRTQDDCADCADCDDCDDCDGPVPAKCSRLCPATGFDSLGVHPRTDGPPPYYDPAASALRLELTQPPYAFGNVLYAQNVLAAVIKDLPDATACQQKCLGACRPLRAAARGIEACLVRCQDNPAACLPECLGKRAESFVKKALDSFWRCLEQCPGALDGSDAERLRSDLDTCRSLPPARQAESLRVCLTELLDGSPPAQDPCVLLCLEISLSLLDAAICLFECLCASPPDLEACARECKTRLEEDYAARLETCMTTCLQPKSDLKYPNDPWLPQATSVRVDYTACTDQPAFFHLLPFGGDQPAVLPSTLLPQEEEAGILYLGFSQLLPPQTLTLLFQMAGNPKPAAELPPVTWEYLAGNRWSKADLLADETGGLQHSGPVRLGLPGGDLLSLRATVPGLPGLFPRTVAITPHVLTATWQSGTQQLPLPAGTINASVQDLPDIGTIAQPLESFGGRLPETPSGFDVRVGERLRHKDRAVLSWDDERLVLERFPTVWKIKALPARDLSGGGVPGSVLVVIVPGPDSLQAVDPTVPTAPGDQLDRIKTYLENLASPFVRFRVVNPVYVRVKVNATVQFTRDSDPGANVKRLNDDLVSYLSPWYYDAERAAKRGRYAFEAEISDFIETRPYVEALDCIDLSHDPDPSALEWYFLTSAEKHGIQEATNA